MINAKVIKDSVSPTGKRLTTMEVEFHRWLLPEFNTHRTFCLGENTTVYFDDPEIPDMKPQGHYLKFAYQTMSKPSWGDRKLRVMQVKESTGKARMVPMDSLVYAGPKDCYRVETKSGKNIVCTADHQLLTTDGWLTLSEAVDLYLDERGVACWKENPPSLFQCENKVNSKAKEDPITSIYHVGETECYDITISDPYDHNFIANNLIVHNSRNSASSRAIPLKKQISKVIRDPALPTEYGLNRPGMQATETLDRQKTFMAKTLFRMASVAAVCFAYALGKLNIHKQVVNRILEPFMWHKVIVTSSEWKNFFTLRDSNLAQPEMQMLAKAMRSALDNSTPKKLGWGEWHTPYVSEAEAESLSTEDLCGVSMARCARVSYLTHDGQRDIGKDLDLAKRLMKDQHWSPAEHVAVPDAAYSTPGNFDGWAQLRHILGGYRNKYLTLDGRLADLQFSGGE